MPLPKRFYYTETCSGKRYVRDPAGSSGVLDLDRLRAGQAAWEDSQPQRLTKPRKLVFADWTAHTWNYKKTRQVEAALSNLIAQGFELYVWESDGQGFEQVVPFNAQHLSDLHDEGFRQKIRLTAPEAIFTAAAKIGLSQESTCILDDYAITQLLQGTDKEIARALPVDALDSALFADDDPRSRRRLRQEEQAQYISLLSSFHPPFQYLALEADAAHMPPKSIAAAFPTLSHVKKYEKIMVWNNDFTATTLAPFQNADRLYIAKMDPKRYQALFSCLPHIEEIIFRGHVEDFSALLRAMPPSVRSLKWRDGEGELSCQGFLPPLPHLEHIVFESHGSGSVSATTIEALLRAAPNMQTLKIDGYYRGKPFLFQQALPILEKLEHLTLAWIEPIESVKQLLNAIPMLRSLDIVCEDLTILFDMNHQERLEILSLLGAGDKIRKNIDLIAIFSHLKVLSLSFESDPATPLCDLPTFTDLEELNLNFTNINQEDLEVLVASAPNLKRLDVFDCPFIDEDALPDHIRAMLVKHPQGEHDAYVRAHPEFQPSDAQPTTDEDFNPEEEQTYIPPSAHNKVFRYAGKNTTKNQTMIAEKLCQYLVLTQKHTGSIKNILDGICNTLAHHFVDKQHTQTWDAFLESIASWDGKPETLTDGLRHEFETLYQMYTLYNDFGMSLYEHYLGDNVALFLEHNTAPCILKNVTHAIAIYPVKGRTSWLVYDPNYIQGAKEVSQTELLAVVHKAIGHLVSVEMPACTVAPHISDPERFIREGGLFVLMNHPEVREALLPIVMQHQPYPPEALNGLLIRNVRGIPAWVCGLQDSELSACTVSFLLAFMQANPTTYQASLQKSIALLTPVQQHEVMTQIVQIFPAGKAKETLLDTVRHTPANVYYENALATWYKPAENIPSHRAYAQTVCNGLIKKRLIECQSTKQLQALQFALEEYCRHQPVHHPVFYVHSPDELACAAAYLERQGTEGHMHSGPGGPLYDFLTAKRDAHCIPILIVNYEQFHTDDIVRLNTLLDKQRNVDGVPLSEQTVIVGLANTNNPNSYQGSDFYSRFDRVEACPLSMELLQTALPVLHLEEASPAEETPVKINLFHSPAWKNQLCGHWSLDGDRIFFQEGVLAAALAEGKPIEIQNGLWQDEEFQRFWYEVARDNPSLSLIRREGYNWESLVSACTPASPDAIHLSILNPQTLPTFFRQVVCDNKKHTLNCALPGLIERAAALPSKTLSVFVSHDLSEDEWAQLLSACQQQGVQLQVQLAEQVQLPAALGEMAFPTSVYPCKALVVVCPPDKIDLTVFGLTQGQKDPIIIHVSDLTISDLWTCTLGSFDTKTNRYHFEEQKRALQLALEKGRLVILKGHFSPELADALLPHLFEDLARNLWIVSDDPEAFPVKSHTYPVNINLMRACLGPLYSELEPFLETEPLYRLRARQDFLSAHPSAISSDEAWQGYHHLPVSMPKEDEALTASDYLTKRADQLRMTLQYSPYVFITGLTGVGKSTFVENHLCKENERLFIGEKELEAWATTSASDGEVFLFVDEATLSRSQFNHFEGLFSTPRSMLINGISYPISDRHKVIFAGNPVSYGDERQLAPFFERHGGAEIFYPLPLHVVCTLILDPIVDQLQADDAEKDCVCEYLLRSYQRCCALSTKEVLMSPRELQMIALLILSAQRRNPDIPLRTLTEHITWEITNPLLPVANRTDPPPTPMERFCSIQSSKAFVVTPSRKKVIQQIEDILDLRALRVTTPQASPALLYGGLGGIILEGEPGVGKSDLVLTLLRAHHFEEQDCHHLDKPATTEHPFYRMPVNFSLAQKEALLLKAFHEGAVVVIDEINSSPMMEALLNDLLMGKAPGNVPPRKPGFLVIGTQNPVTLAGRRAPSPALARRLIHIDVPPYPREELMEILTLKGVPPAQASALIDAYQKQVSHAKFHRLTPAPTFRNLERLADEITRAQSNQQTGYIAQQQDAKATVGALREKGNVHSSFSKGPS